MVRNLCWSHPPENPKWLDAVPRSHTVRWRGLGTQDGVAGGSSQRPASPDLSQREET